VSSIKHIADSHGHRGMVRQSLSSYEQGSCRFNHTVLVDTLCYDRFKAHVLILI